MAAMVSPSKFHSPGKRLSDLSHSIRQCPRRYPAVERQKLAQKVELALGVAVKHDFVLDNGVTISAGARLGWKHEFGDAQLSSLTSFAVAALSGAAPIACETNSLAQDRDMLQAGASLGTSFTGKNGYVYAFKAG